MYKYKRGINNLEQAKQLEYTLSNNLDTCLSLSGTLDCKKPYNGMYIKNGKVMLSNIMERIEIKDKVYKMGQLTTSVQNISCDEYIVAIDLNTNTFEYNIGPLSYMKKIAFDYKSNILCIEYEIVNREKDQVNFKVIPMITYRDLYIMKNSQMLKFNQRKDKNGVVINLSIMNQDDMILKSDTLDFTKDAQNLTNVKHEYIDTDCTKKLFTEDLVIPGEFETVIKAKSSKTVKLYVSSKEFDLGTINEANIFENHKCRKDKLVSSIEEEYVELKDLANAIDNIDMENLCVSSLPNRRNYDMLFENIDNLKIDRDVIKYIEELTEIVRAIDGEYLTFNKIKEANFTLMRIRKYIKILDTFKNDDKEFMIAYARLKLWYVESVNRILQKDKNYDLYIDIVKDIIYYILDKENRKMFLRKIDIVALTCNALKIYQNMLDWKNLEDANIFEEDKNLFDLIENEFWCEDTRIMKKDLDEEISTASIEMIYTLSLSYPCIVDEIPIKLLDTIFKELYTPYGLREISKNSSNADGLIYPKYMAHFVKANLRQNGVTRASQKIAYNLVKELVLDIGKYVNGGIKKIYNEKGISVDSVAFDLLTNAEMIRLYNMLT